MGKKYTGAAGGIRIPAGYRITMYLVLCVLVVVYAGPIVWMLLSSMKNLRQFFAYPPVFFPVPMRFENYAEVFRLFPLARYIINTVFIAGVITVAQLFSTSTAGFAFAALNFKGKKTIFLVFLAGMMVPFTVVLIPLFTLIRNLGLVDTYWGLIVPFVFSPYGIFLMRQFFLGIPKDLYDSAHIDGCSEFRIYRSIYLPLSGPALATLTIQAFVFFYNGLLWPLIVINTELKKTVSVGLLSLIARDVTSPHLVMAGAAVSVIPMVIVFISFQKYFIKGIVMTGLKG
jgi:multiple sugar transport system permease protein